MIIIGLTGSIGMGKSTTAEMFRRFGIPVQDADAVVHTLMGKGGRAVGPIEALFPGVTKNGAIDRKELGNHVFSNPARLQSLEKILHPMVSEDRAHFLRQAGLRRIPIVVLDVPLLFETQGERKCDFTILVTAPAMVQAARVIARPGMTRQRLNEIRNKQMPDRLKRKKASYLFNTGLGKRPVLGKVKKIVTEYQSGCGHYWPLRPLPRFPNSHPRRRSMI